MTLCRAPGEACHRKSRGRWLSAIAVVCATVTVLTACGTYASDVDDVPAPESAAIGAAGTGVGRQLLVGSSDMLVTGFWADRVVNFDWALLVSFGTSVREVPVPPECFERVRIGDSWPSDHSECR